MKQKQSRAKTSQKPKAKPEVKMNDKKNDWLNPKVFILLAIVFIITQSLGLYLAGEFIRMDLAQPVNPFAENVNDISNSIYLIGIILFTTLIILIALKFRKNRNFLIYIEALAVFTTSLLVFSVLLPGFEFLIALAIIAWRYTHIKSVSFRNLVAVIAVAGAGSFIGISNRATSW